MLRKYKNKNSSEEEFSPLSSLANLADVMFVFSVGLLVALASIWNVNPVQGSNNKPKQSAVNIKQGKELPELPQIGNESGSGYEEMGTVFKDPKTGKLIMILPSDE